MHVDLHRRYRLIVAILIAGAAVLPMAGSGPRKTPVRASTESPVAVRILRQANEVYRSGNHLAALRLYQDGLKQARADGDPRTTLKFLTNLGSSNYQLLRYRDAAKAYLEAKTLASAQDRPEILAALSVNLSSIYLQMGDLEAATETASQGLALPPAASAKFRSRLLIQLSLLRLRSGNCSAAIAGYYEAIEASRDQLDVPAEAQSWNELGNAFADCGDPKRAEDALLESYRLRKLTHDDRLPFSYEALAQLRLAQNDPAGAVRFLDLVLDSDEGRGSAALWRPLYARGRARLALGQTQGAYADLAASLAKLKEWRLETIPADAFRVSAEVELHRVYSAFIAVAGRLYRETSDRRYALASFAAAESERAGSLRMLWAGSDAPRQLPEEYWQALAQLHKAESKQLQRDSDGSEVRRIRLKLAEMETQTGLTQTVDTGENSDPASLLRATQGALGPSEAFLGFHTGESVSWLWVVTKGSFDLIPLPPAESLKKEVTAYVEALRNSAPDASEQGTRLFEELFGRLNPRARAASTWSLAADGPLFDLPFAALRDSFAPGGNPYLIETHTLRAITGIAALLEPTGAPSTGAFLGVGDPIYNRADSRYSAKGRPLSTAILDAVRPGSTPTRLELPRLAGTAREIESCASLWRSNHRGALLLTGSAATKQNVFDALRHRPAVVHFAGHMLFPEGESGRGLLALSLQPGNELDFVTETEAMGIPMNADLVVLSGCSSGRGPVLPGAGLMGMTRGWLAAGARAVIATRWPASDQEGAELFQSFYRRYFAERTEGKVSFGSLLREAQLAQIRAGGSRADPGRWASYFCVERN